jgi:hypothetical protein
LTWGASRYQIDSSIFGEIDFSNVGTYDFTVKKRGMAHFLIEEQRLNGCSVPLIKSFVPESGIVKA